MIRKSRIDSVRTHMLKVVYLPPQLPFANTVNYYLTAQSISKDLQEESERREREIPTDGYRSAEELQLSLEDGKENVANVTSQIFPSINKIS